MSSDFGRMLSVGAIRFEDRSALAERMGQGEVGGCTALADSAWRRLWLPVEEPLSMPVGHLSAFLNKRA